jgi:hypothetical protein
MVENLIPKAPFARLVKEITHDLGLGITFRFRAEALEALQEAAEAALVHEFECKSIFIPTSKLYTNLYSNQPRRHPCEKNYDPTERYETGSVNAPRHVRL